MRRALAGAAVVALVFVIVGAVTFPTDAIVRRVLERIRLPEGMTLTFAAARLRPTGLRLDDVHVMRPGGRSALDAASLRLRPSLWGFWRDRTGRPWSIAADTCQGTIDVTIGAEPSATPIRVTFEHVELATCLPYVLPQIEAYGRIDGTVTFRLGSTDPSQSTGALELRGAAWKPGGPLEDTPLRADAAALGWRLADQRLELTKIEASSQDFQATGGGVIHLVTPTDDSPLDLRVAVTPGPTMPLLLRRYFDAIAGAAPDARGTRTFRIQGLVRDPRVSAAGRFP